MLVRMGAYLSAREAADYCGVSEKTIRNWLQLGRLSADKSARAFRIPQAQLDALRQDGPRSPRGADRQPAGSAEDVRAEGPHVLTTAEVLALVREAQAETIAKAEAAAMWQARAEMLGHQLRALETPRPHQTATDARETAEGPDSPSEPSEPTPAPSPAPMPILPQPNGGSPWWRRAWTALVGT